jgi:hypothetical protein
MQGICLVKLVREWAATVISVGHGEKKSHFFSLAMYLYSLLKEIRSCLDVVFFYSSVFFYLYIGWFPYVFPKWLSS